VGVKLLDHSRQHVVTNAGRNCGLCKDAGWKVASRALL